MDSLAREAVLRDEIGWELNLSRHEEEFNEICIAEARTLLSDWVRVFPRENSWIQNTYGVPSLIVRLDCTSDENGHLQVFEVEERPAGIGVSTRVNPDFNRKLEAIRKHWPNVKYVVSSHRQAHDDRLWIKQISLAEACQNGSLLIIRAEPKEEEFHALVKKSVSTFLTKGDKSYGERLGLWKKVSVCDIDELPWDDGFCIKPVQGSKCTDVEIWHPGFSRGKHKRASTRSQIQRTLIKNGEMYMQKLIMPMPCSVVAGNFMIYRAFFGYNPQTNSYEFLGGLWNSRKHLRVHGASDSIMGPLTMFGEK